MDLSTLEKKEAPLLSRTEITGEIAFSGKTPSFAELKQALSKSLKLEEPLIVIKSIYNEFGKQKARFTAYIYKDAASLKKIEPKIKEKKAKAEKAPAEAKK